MSAKQLRAALTLAQRFVNEHGSADDIRIVHAALSTPEVLDLSLDVRVSSTPTRAPGSEIPTLPPAGPSIASLLSGGYLTDYRIGSKCPCDPSGSCGTRCPDPATGKLGCEGADDGR